jgi:Secretion system C-terminal sorting domain
LGSSPSGGVWSSSSPAVATVGSSSGVVTGVSVGVTNISRRPSTGCYAIYPVTVTPLPCTTGISQLHTGPSPDLQLFPNPATDELTIQAGQVSYSSYIISNAAGRMFLAVDLTGAQTQVRIKSLPAGLYYLTLHGDVGYTTRKFVKE